MLLSLPLHAAAAAAVAAAAALLVQSFYRKYAPEFVTRANKILTKFKGREAELFAKVAAKYDAPPEELVPA